MNATHEPIFVVCTGRSGSTLLRYILDTHEKIEAPQELHLGPMIKELKRVTYLLHEDKKADFKDYEAFVNNEVRTSVDALLRNKITKEIWCDKSVSTIDFIEDVMQVFPKARYLFLYRDCLDFVHSALEVSKYGFQGFWFEEYILKNPENIVDGLVDFWCMQSEKRMAIEAQSAYDILPIKYEDLVHKTDQTLAKLFDFLGLKFQPSILDEMFTKFRVGRGDLKVQSYRRIHKNTGKGRYVPLKKISDSTFQRMNTTLQSLGYPKVDKNINFTYNEKGSNHDLHSYFEDKLITYFEGVLGEHIPPPEISNDVMQLDIAGIENSVWQIDFTSGKLVTEVKDLEAKYTIKLRIDILMKIIDRDLNISMAYRDGYLETDASYQKINELGKYLFG